MPAQKSSRKKLRRSAASPAARSGSGRPKKRPAQQSARPVMKPGAAPLAPFSGRAAEATGLDAPSGKSAAARPARLNRNLAAFPIVALGASAGGLEALTQLLERIPPDSGMAFVVVQHLDPSHRSILPELLAKVTSMPVIEVTEGTKVMPNHVYVMPPNRAMEIQSGVLRLTPRTRDEAGRRPIDTFMYSLAAEQGNRAVGVILSGTASDGTLGLRAIKEEGGITFAQDRASAKFDGMPAAAIAGGAVDFVFPVEDIARELMQIARHPYFVLGKEHADHAEDQFSEENLKTIFGLLRATCGVDFTYYKHSTIRRRILRRMMVNHLEKVEEYVELMKHSSAEITALFNDILINVTEFFRDPEIFEALKTEVFPHLVQGRPTAAAPLRIWVPGCAGGEEAYSIAMCLLEFFEASGNHAPVQIFATDISEASLERARAGLYPETSLAGVSSDRQRRFFTKLTGGYQVAKVVRDMCMFARQDLSKDPPFSRIDLISCRNVLIYLGTTLQKRVIPAFHYALKPDGYLLLGSSESIGSFGELFALVDKQHRIYRKKPGVSHLRLQPEAMLPAWHEAERTGAQSTVDVSAVEREADRLLLGRYSPPGVLINESMTILQFRGQTGRYLEPATGAASLNLLKMARDDLHLPLRKVISEAVQRGTSARVKGQRMRFNGGVRSVDIEVIPVSTVPVTQGRYFLVLFSDAKSENATAAEAERNKKGHARRERGEVAKLRQELVATREYLQSVIEEQEAANEELRSANEEAQSTNEELQSINEELETAKEELQSTNEELTTINEELENVNHELSQTNNDLKNLLDAVDVAIVMLGANLRIRRFTPPAAALLNLIPTDVGRPLGDLKPKIDAPELEQWITSVTETLIPLQREVSDQAGHRYDIRIKPYRTAENKIDGVVVTIFERGEAEKGAT